MNNDLPFLPIASGRYIVAVSGGVDSMVLLHMLAAQPNLDLIVAHLDHGVRLDSAQDEQLVRRTAQAYGLPYESRAAHLGAHVGEAEARRVRYDFLREVQSKYSAKAIITAHHQDDLIETACINMLRGTGRRGLNSLQSGEDVVRPLLGISKRDIVAYARQNRVAWHEDSTNASDAYLRNRVRRHIVSGMSPAQRRYFLDIITKQQHLNTRIEAELQAWAGQHLIVQKNDWVELARYQIIMLPAEVAFEVIQYCSRQVTGTTIPTNQAWLALEAVKSLRNHKILRIHGGLQIEVLPKGKIRLRRSAK